MDTSDAATKTPKLPRCTLPGDPAPWFIIASTVNKGFRFNSAGGRRVALCFLGSLTNPDAARALAEFYAAVPDLRRMGVYPFGITVDPSDEANGRLAPFVDRLTFFFDYDRSVSRAFGVEVPDPNDASRAIFSPTTILLDEGMRLVDRLPVVPNRGHGDDVRARSASLPPRAPRRPIDGVAPVLLLPNVLDRKTCSELIQQWTDGGNEDSGYMRTDDKGRLVGYINYGRKRRRDHFVESNDRMYKRLSVIVKRRVVIAVKRAYHYDITRVERFCVACYDAAEGGYFKAHRDFENPSTCHRAFAMTINLNAEDYEGGELIFPEYGQHLYRPGTGDAVIFSGYLMHEALPVARGRRFALLSFFYGENEAQVRKGYRETHGTDHETIRVNR